MFKGTVTQLSSCVLNLRTLRYILKANLQATLMLHMRDLTQRRRKPDAVGKADALDSILNCKFSVSVSGKSISGLAKVNKM